MAPLETPGLHPLRAAATLSDPDRRAAVLREWCAARGAKPSALLDEAEKLMHDDPAAALWLATAARTMARDVATDAHTDPARLLARAALLQGQGLAIAGRHVEALEAVDAARHSFLAAGDPWLALRTDLGRMNIWNELGENERALAIGTALLASVDELLDDIGSSSPPFEVDWLRASALTNIGICHVYGGSYEDAAAANAAAEAHLVRLGRLDEIAILRQNQAEQLLEDGQAHQARTVLAAAVEAFEEAGLALLQARCLGDLGRAHTALGDGALALAAFERAERVLDRLDIDAEREQLRLHTAEAYLALNLLGEAALVYEQVAGSARVGGRAHYLATALTGLGAALAGRQRWAEARLPLEEAAQRHDRTGNVPLATAARVELAAVLARLGEHDAAVEMLRSCLVATRNEQHRLSRVYVLLGLADVSDAAEADQVLAEAADLVELLGLPPLRFRVHSRLGALRRQQGRLAEARQLLELAADQAEDQRALLASQLVRTSFLRDKSRTFDDLVAVLLDEAPGRPEASFAAAERAKSRALLDQLNGASPSSWSHRADTDERAAAAELDALYDEMLAGRRPAALLRRTEELQTRLSVARMSRVPDRTEPLPIRAASGLVDHPNLRERLAPSAVLIAFHVVGDEVLRFVSTEAGLTGTRVSTLTRLGPMLTGLEQRWRQFRAGPAFVARHAQRLLVLVEHDLKQLSRELLDGIGLLHHPTGLVRRLAIVVPPHLHGVPFHALPVGEHRLVEDWEIVTGPSASVLTGLPPWHPGDRSALVLSSADPTIPHAEQEARAVADLLPGSRVHVGAEATIGLLEREAGDAAIVHLACHAAFQPQDASFSGLRLADGWLAAGEVAGLALTGSLVTLSACETGRQQAVGGEAVGLTTAVLAAGAAAVVSSLWMADDRSTSAQMQDFYTHVRCGLTPAAALREAQLASLGRDPHPYHWAPFGVISAC